MNSPISCEFYDQLMVVIQRKIPSTIVYLENEQTCTIKGVVTELMMIEYEEFLMLKSGKKIHLQSIFSLNGKKHKEI
ncbi:MULTISPECIES: hypothetical protein [unclassified Sulfurospirillum]|uniref:hypothetical protein n=1 Tax=unclassified Sulfurospirillum TaxID=2618290 RepID=UPI000503D8EE|nr:MULTISPECIES: hypothetical protein [unclassified Sulfurospirillum]KFL34552.1 transcriptional antiterminator Rof [Sulfurospirillum sp. SCADC]